MGYVSKATDIGISLLCAGIGWIENTAVYVTLYERTIDLTNISFLHIAGEIKCNGDVCTVRITGGAVTGTMARNNAAYELVKQAIDVSAVSGTNTVKLEFKTTGTQTGYLKNCSIWGRV